MRLLYGYELRIQAIEAGTATIEALTESKLRGDAL